MSKGPGWHNDRYQHSLAARGVTKGSLRSQATIMNDPADKNIRGHIAAKIEILGIEAEPKDVNDLINEIDEAIREWKESQRFSGSTSAHRIEVLISDMHMVRSDLTQYNQITPDERNILISRLVRRIDQ